MSLNNRRNNDNSFNGQIPEESRLAGTRISPLWILLELKVMEVVVTTGLIERAKLQSNHHHQQTDTQLFTAWMPFLSSNKQCQSTERKKYHSPCSCLLQAHLGSSHFVFNHYKLLGNPPSGSSKLAQSSEWWS